MYSHRKRRPPTTPPPLDNKALLSAVHTISNSLVRRATLAATDPSYSILLTDIWAQARYTDLQVLALRSNDGSRRFRRRSRNTTTSTTTTTTTTTSESDSTTSSIAHITAKKDAARDALVRLLRRVPVDSLTENERRLTTGILDRPGIIDTDAIRRLWGVPSAVFEAAAIPNAFNLYGISFVIVFYDAFIAGYNQNSRVFNALWWREKRNQITIKLNLDMYRNKRRKRKNDFPLLATTDQHSSCNGNGNHLLDDAATEVDVEMEMDDSEHEDEIQNDFMDVEMNPNNKYTDRELLFGSNDIGNDTRSKRVISKDIIIEVLRLLLTKRRSPFFEQNMSVVLETVLYAIHPDRCINHFREAQLRDARFHEGLQAYEYSRSFCASLENLHLGKLNRLLKDIRAVRTFDPPQERFKDNERIRLREKSPQYNVSNTTSKLSHCAIEKLQSSLSVRALRKYCADRDTLTERALQGVLSRYVKNTQVAKVNTIELSPKSKSRYAKKIYAHHAAYEFGMTDADFVRMYLALVGSGTDQGLKYWFAILDQDGDGWVGVGDIAHFYKERKMESEKRNGIKLADINCLWTRLCAMSGVPPNGKGINLQSLRELSKEDREFVMCALLVRRADDGNLINVAATVSANEMPNGNKR